MAPSGPYVVSEGQEPVSFDLVFVHGLRGDRVGTWKKGQTFWPEKLLSKEEGLENARIITWGYDSSVANVTEFSSQNSLFGHSENLLGDLADLRRKRKAKSRPIVFIGHSLGGLVIKEALIRSSEYLHNRQDPNLGAVYDSTAGVVFIGTPHRGSDKTTIAHIVEGIAKLAFRQPNAKVTHVLERDSDILERQRRSFASITKTMPLVCFYEEKPTAAGLIVDETSATIDGFYVTSKSIPENHMDMCKFELETDIGYIRISGQILNLISQATQGESQAEREGASTFNDSLSRDPGDPGKIGALPSPQKDAHRVGNSQVQYEVEEL